MSAVKSTSSILKWASKDGAFHRKPSAFRSWISRDADAKFQPEKGRYHLYVSYACPWAHRTLIVRKLKGLDGVIGVSVLHYLMGDDGWAFSTENECPGATPDSLYGCSSVKELYHKANPEYEGRYTVPVLWDKKLHTIVSNESSEIIRMLNSEFNEFVDKKYKEIDFYPQAHQKEIDEINSWILTDINNGVYKAGFATKQEPYEESVKILFSALDRVENILKAKTYLVGDALTEADIRLFTTIIRFDPVYHGHFKCNLKQISHDYPMILKWLKMVYKIDGVSETVNMTHIKNHYYMSHIQINPTQVVPLSNGPDLSSL